MKYNIETVLSERILVLDGAMGTAIQNFNLTAQDFGGEEYEGCNENLILSKPEVLAQIHEDYLKAGCDIIETNTFGGTALVLDEFNLGKKAYEINLKSAQLARRLADQYSTPNKPRFVAGSIGPTTKALSVTGGATFEQLIEEFKNQIIALIDGGVDYLLFETCQDTRNIKAQFLAADEVFQSKRKVPIAVSGTIEPMGTMLAGQSIEALIVSLMHRNLLYLGLNCATGPEFMTDPIRTLAKLSPFRVSCVPNAGLPDEDGCYLETPKMVGGVLLRFIEQGWINVLGGCCGTHAGHISEIVKLAEKGRPRPITEGLKASTSSYLSGVDALEITDEMRPVIVGERTNVIGSKKFKTLIVEEKFEEAADLGRSQVKNGAQIIDICLANPDRDELKDSQQFLEFAVKKIRAPLMIDSTDEKVVADALTYSQGKAIINSINLEDGLERFEKIVPLAKKFGAALVVGTIDEDPTQGMAVSRKRKLEVAKREYDILTKEYGILPQDIYFDPLVFPCATGDAQYFGSALETIEGLRLIKKEMPLCRTVLGISNVSFGLPTAGREALNSVFLYHCVQAGLDLAIVNSEKLIRMASLSEQERKLCENLLLETNPEKISLAVQEFAAFYRSKKSHSDSFNQEKLPLLERLPRYIIEGSKDGLTDDLKEALLTLKPLEIINGPLMKGMDEVGRLFNANQLIVAEVLQSAEAMKAAVAYLEPYMEKNASGSLRGKILLATVKGDVHDIGKNLVEIILSNNGFEVVNLGIKVPPEQLIQAVREHKPAAIGLSGLLVKSAHQMVTTAEDFSKAGIDIPILVGGAALTENFTDKQIAKAYTTGSVVYASDAMSGLELAKKVTNPQAKIFLDELKTKQLQKQNAQTPSIKPTLVVSERRSEEVRVLALNEIPEAPTNRRVIRNTPVDQIWKYINPLMLYGRHLGIKGGVVRKLEEARGDAAILRELYETEAKALKIWQTVEEVKVEFKDTSIMHPQAVYQYFNARALSTNTLGVFDENNSALLAEFHFPRQARANGLCLTDYVRGDKDQVCFFLVTAGRGVREMAESLKNRGDYLKSHVLQALALETAEAYAELLHSQIRKEWGYPDPLDMRMMDRFQAKYRGKRYSFGYPACPKLDDQEKLFKLIKPESVGVQLTDGFMMDPEASVSAIVFHHPDATYFSVGTQGEVGNDNRS